MSTEISYKHSYVKKCVALSDIHTGGGNRTVVPIPPILLFSYFEELRPNLVNDLCGTKRAK
jgi:hypothetical protein